METSRGEFPNESSGNVLVRALRKWLLHRSHVVAVDSLSKNFRVIHLEGDDLQSLEWIPGHQIQITTGAGLMGRTYTPINWDRHRGRTSILVYLHGNGPGSTWARTVRSGSSHDFLGPTRPLNVTLDEPLNLFGDETAFGLGLALRNAASADLVPRFVFEVSDLQESQHVLESFGLCDAVLIKRTEGDDHLTGAASRIFDHSTAIHQIILSGNARSIQQIKKLKSAKADGISRVIVKPYWSPGKTGMS